ncbi:MAG: hypothetical protein LBL74_05445 [Bacteroidales bacterium]|nr:hypothetical protein [Bacteroidales bacterium]
MNAVADADYAQKKRLFKFLRRHFCPTEGRSWLYGLRMAFLEFAMAILETYTKNCKVHLRGVLQGICNFIWRFVRTLFDGIAAEANNIGAIRTFAPILFVVLAMKANNIVAEAKNIGVIRTIVGMIRTYTALALDIVSMK